MSVIILGGVILLARLIFGAPFDPDRKKKPVYVQIQENPPLWVKAKPEKTLFDYAYYASIVLWALYVIFDVGHWNP